MRANVTATARIQPRTAVPATYAACVLGALSVGALVSHSPKMALALATVGLAFLLPWIAPVTHLTILLFVTGILPFSVQNAVSAGSAGLVVSDLLLLGGLVRVGILFFRQPLARRQLLAAIALAVILVVAFVGFLRGWHAGRDVSQVGFEFRVVLGLATLLLTVPLLNDEKSRARLTRALLMLGIVLGVWGIYQFFGNIGFAQSGDSGLRQGVNFTTSGRGQVQGGLFAFPVAATMAFATLMSGAVRSLRLRATLVVVTALNVVSMLLTYERTFWVATTLAFAFIAIKAGRLERLKAVIAALAILIGVFSVMATVAPNELTAARERLLSLSQYNDDNSVRYRVAETRAVFKEVKQRPLAGSGLAATTWWGRPWELVAPRSNGYAHNGYLWLAWKLGIPVAALMTALMLAAVARRSRPSGGVLFRGVWTGAQAAILIMLVATVTFPSFAFLAVTPLMGVVLAVCFAAGPARERAAGIASDMAGPARLLRPASPRRSTPTS